MTVLNQLSLADYDTQISGMLYSLLYFKPKTVFTRKISISLYIW